MDRTLLSLGELKTALSGLKDWHISDDGKSITKEFKFKNFVQAFEFMTRISVVAEDMNHHPDWRNVYNKVFVTLQTHDASGVTALDIALAKAMDM